MRVALRRLRSSPTGLPRWDDRAIELGQVKAPSPPQPHGFGPADWFMSVWGINEWPKRLGFKRLLTLALRRENLFSRGKLDMQLPLIIDDKPSGIPGRLHRRRTRQL